MNVEHRTSNSERRSVDTLPKPYYEDDFVTIYHSRSEDVIDFLPMCGLLLTDPPYGINGGRGGTSRKRGRGNYDGDFTKDDDTRENIIEHIVPIIVKCLAKCKSGIVTPGNKNFCHYPQPDSFGVMYQPQGTGAQRWGWCDAQPIFYYGISPVQGQKLEPCSFKVTKTDECKNGHPYPKPLSFWKKLLLKGAWKNDIVLDPFMGSGTTLRASKDAGLRAIGIEITEAYCEIAARRCSQEVLAI